MSKPKTKALSHKEFAALVAVKTGADIYSYDIAKTLREIEKTRPGLIEITKPRMYRGKGVSRVPYFGAICTDAGLVACREAERKFAAKMWRLAESRRSAQG